MVDRLKTGSLLALAIVPAAVLLLAIQRYGVDFPYLDHWTLAGLFQKIEQGTLSPWDLATPHNESRMFFPRLGILPLAYLSGWNVKLEMFISFLLAAVASINVYRLARATFPGNRRIALSLLAAANLLIFSVVQWEHWLWGFAIVAFVPIVLLTLGLLVVCSGWNVTTKVLVNIVLATVATFSFSSGLMCWLVLMPVLVLRDPGEIRNRMWLVAVWLGATVVNAALYFTTYSRPEPHPSLLEAFRHPLDAIVFHAAFLGAPLGWVLGRDLAPALAVSTGIGFASLGLFLVAAAMLWIRRGNAALRRRSAPWLGIAGFVLLSGGMLTAGRLGIGIEYALQSRYTTASVYMGVALIFLFATLLDEERRTAGCLGGVTTSHVATVLLTLFVTAHAITSVHQWKILPDIKHRRLAGKAMLTLINVAPDMRTLGDLVTRRVDTLVESARSADRQGLLDPPLLASNHVRDIAGTPATDASYGALEQHALRRGELMLRGWAVLPDRGEPAHAVLLCHETPGSEPQIFAAVTTDTPRPDIVERIGRSRYRLSGWLYRGALPQPVPRGTTVSAWAFDTVTRTAYRLDGSAELRSVPSGFPSTRAGPS